MPLCFYWYVLVTLLCYHTVWLLCIFPRSSFLKTVVVHPSNKKEYLIVLETISISFTVVVASLAVRSRFPLLLSARHFLIPCHPFTAEINCYVRQQVDCYIPHAFFGLVCCYHRTPAELPRSRARGIPVPFSHSPAPGSLSPSHRQESGVGSPLRAFEDGCAFVCPHHMSPATV